MGNFNLGNYGGLLSLADRNRAAGSVASSYPQNAAVQRAAQQNTLGSLGQRAVGNNPYASPQQQGSSGWAQTQKYLGGAANLQSGNSNGQKNGLSKVLGLVGMFA